ncbi:MAG: DUF2027 domain-containing protein [Bacteroidetes bacterium]|nr:DUF2027 domain-containing protein [Bacteroidota bacterium]
MKYKLGEFVRFVDERREGYITKIIDETTIAVSDEDGFEIPILASKVTRVHGKSEITESISSVNLNTQGSESLIINGIYLAIADDKKIGSVVHLYLLNESSWEVLLSFKTERHNKYKGEFAGLINPNATVKVYTASHKELDLWPKFHIQTLLYSTMEHEAQKPLIFSDQFKAKDFSRDKKNHRLLDHPAWMIQLDSNTTTIDPIKLKESFFKPATAKNEILIPGKEVDLHIEKLRDDYHFLSGSEILSLQLNHFKKYLDAAIVHEQDAIVFIHGVGNGMLRTEVHKILSKHPQVKTFMDAQNERFGYGATEVLIKI